MLSEFFFFVAVLLGYSQYWLGGFMFFLCIVCFLFPVTREGSTGSGYGFNLSQKTDHGLKYFPTYWEKPGIEPATPGLQDIDLSPTPRRLQVLYIT